MRITWQLIVTLGLLILSTNAAHARQQPARIMGYTVTLEEVLVNRDGSSQVVAGETQALRPDGATVLRLGAAGSAARFIRIPPGLYIETNDRDRRMSTFHVSQDFFSEVRDPKNNCVRGREEYEGEEVVAGYRAARIVRQSGATTAWYALDHFCAPVRSLVQHQSGSRSEKFLVSLVKGPPSESLFDTSGYVEGPPSALGPVTDCDEACRERRKRRDAEYYKRRPK